MVTKTDGNLSTIRLQQVSVQADSRFKRNAKNMHS